MESFKIYEKIITGLAPVFGGLIYIIYQKVDKKTQANEKIVTDLTNSVTLLKEQHKEVDEMKSEIKDMREERMNINVQLQGLQKSVDSIEKDFGKLEASIKDGFTEIKNFIKTNVNNGEKLF